MMEYVLVIAGCLAFVCFFFYFVASIVKGTPQKTEEGINNLKKTIPTLPKEPEPESAPEEINEPFVDLPHFRDHFGENIADYSYLTPGQARYELKSRKAAGEYLDWDEYIGYIDVIASEKDERYLDFINKNSIADIHKWFIRKTKSNVKMSTKIWKEVAKRLAPEQEAYLIKEMQKCTPGTIESFVTNRKHDGYFFTPKAYDVANEIYAGTYPLLLERKEMMRQKRLVKIQITRAETSYLKAINENKTKKADDYKLKLETLKSKLHELEDKLANQ